MKLIVDSGSTKTTWCILLPSSETLEVQTMGINPVRDDEHTLQTVIQEARAAIEAKVNGGQTSSSKPETSFSQVHFYGAGCIPPYSATVCHALEEAFLGAQVSVESDLLGAARALCGHSEGIACILGTGSNSCLYDGQRIVQNVSPLGWILGDEGSGAVLGRMLVGDLLKGQLPAALREAFEARFLLTPASIIESVYRQPLPNRFLASLVPFLAEHRSEAPVRDFLVREFRRFLSRNVASYARHDLLVNFVGGVAYQFEDELRTAVLLENFMMGRVERAPIGSMVHFHASEGF